MLYVLLPLRGVVVAGGLGEGKWGTRRVPTNPTPDRLREGSLNASLSLVSSSSRLAFKSLGGGFSLIECSAHLNPLFHARPAIAAATTSHYLLLPFTTPMLPFSALLTRLPI